jgi:hypothetical protein
MTVKHFQIKLNKRVSKPISIKKNDAISLDAEIESLALQLLLMLLKAHDELSL